MKKASGMLAHKSENFLRSNKGWRFQSYVTVSMWEYKEVSLGFCWFFTRLIWKVYGKNDPGKNLYYIVCEMSH